MFGDIVIAISVVVIAIIIFAGIGFLFWKRDVEELLQEPGHKYGDHWTHE